ncbi:MAG: acylphosphatase [ANME-2 cluster archaeon]|nr:acylphosphatase [ANME-2 cluster archaeon]
MKRVILHVSGNIQRAIYRRKVMSIAKTIGITGAIMNLLDGRMKIIAEWDDNFEYHRLQNFKFGVDVGVRCVHSLIF